MLKDETPTPQCWTHRTSLYLAATSAAHRRATPARIPGPGGRLNHVTGCHAVLRLIYLEILGYVSYLYKGITARREDCVHRRHRLWRAMFVLLVQRLGRSDTLPPLTQSQSPWPVRIPYPSRDQRNVPGRCDRFPNARAVGQWARRIVVVGSQC